jgi:hypothetical protein
MLFPETTQGYYLLAPSGRRSFSGLKDPDLELPKHHKTCPLKGTHKPRA